MAGYDSIWRFSRTTLAILLATAWSAQAALGQYTFVQDTDNTGHWDFPESWLDGASNTTYPNAPGATVLINAPTWTGAATYNLLLPAANITVGELKIDNTNYADTYRTNIGEVGNDDFRLIFQSTSGPAKYTETIGSAPGATNSQYDFKGRILVNSDLIITQDNYPNLNTGTIFENLVEGAADKTIFKEGHGGIQFNYNAFTGPPFNETPFQGHVVINQGDIRLISTSPFSNVADITVHAGGQLKLADNAQNPTNTDWNLGTGVLNLNGPGKATDSPQTVNNPDGALRFALGQATATTTTLHNPVVLQSDSVISVSANGGNPLTGVIDSIVSGPGGLTKHGTGTLILSNASDSYTGDTKVVAGGPLSITNPFLADGRDVWLVTGSTFNLNFSATDTIRSFFIDGIAQATGTWGAVGSVAAHQSALITGAGLLNVTTLPPMGVPGDYNGNGVVDMADYVLWRNGGPLQNEVATTGSVTPEDYTEWRARFGNTSGSGSGALAVSAAIPEPGSLLLATFAVFGLLAMPRKR